MSESKLTEEQIQELEKYMELPGIKVRMEMWTRSNGNARPPIFWDETKRQWWWANRDQRNKMR